MRVQGGLLTVILGLLLVFGTVDRAAADDIFYPGPGDWNGKTVYLSEACHDAGSGQCQPNYGCKGSENSRYNENAGSHQLALQATQGSQTYYENLLERGYRVRIGNGLAAQNIANSNSWGSTVHVPLHSNAAPGWSYSENNCKNENNPASAKGTWGLYMEGVNGKSCATDIRDTMGPSTPGNDRIYDYPGTLGEVSQIQGAVCYFESNFHTFNGGVNWLRDQQSWGGEIGHVVDVRFGYP
ncbi:hypothetical protein GCM10027062_21800 [Nocardioides hungaricus]|jgi:hypothetical protein